MQYASYIGKYSDIVDVEFADAAFTQPFQHPVTVNKSIKLNVKRCKASCNVYYVGVFASERTATADITNAIRRFETCEALHCYFGSLWYEFRMFRFLLTWRRSLLSTIVGNSWNCLTLKVSTKADHGANYHCADVTQVNSTPRSTVSRFQENV